MSVKSKLVASITAMVMALGLMTAQVSVAQATELKAAVDYPVGGGIKNAWLPLKDKLGNAISPEKCGLKDGGCAQEFQGGTVYWSPATSGHATWGAIDTKWKSTQSERGSLGYPTSNERRMTKTSGAYQYFQGGMIIWSQATGAKHSSGAILGRWKSNGWESTTLRYPTNDEKCTLKNGGCYQSFQGGSIHWSPNTGAHATFGEIRDMWKSSSYENGKYGYPTSEATVRSDGKLTQKFEGGTITTSKPVSTGLPYSVTADGGRQMIIAHAGSRKSTKGTVELWELGNDARWTKKHGFSDARFGYGGLKTPGQKTEGDGGTPMGQYTIPFGFGKSKKPAGTGIDYRNVTSTSQWCSKSGSKNYNRWMDRADSSCEAKDAEVLSKYAQYSYAAVINYNEAQKSNKGSAIFLHVHGKGSTAGCISVTSSQMQTTLKWLDDGKQPHIVIAPKDELKNQ